MSRFIDLTGNKYNFLTVISRAESKNGKAYWNCICDCGNTTVVSGSNLKTGGVKSCGCLSSRLHPIIKHGESGTTLYHTWCGIIARCENPNHPHYKDYGGRGIKVCDEWHEYLNFKDWVNSTRKDESLTIDRIDTNGNYCPENCRWATKKEQANNRRSNLLFTYNNETHNLSEWCEILGLNYYNVHNRIYKLKWTFEKAISTPIDIKKRNKIAVERT